MALILSFKSRSEYNYGGKGGQMKDTIICALVLVMVFFAGFLIYRNWLSRDNSGMDKSVETEYLNGQWDCTVYVYGEEIKFPGPLSYEKLATLQLSELDYSCRAVYLVINELNAERVPELGLGSRAGRNGRET